jgi:hypothetical protein
MRASARAARDEMSALDDHVGGGVMGSSGTSSMSLIMTACGVGDMSITTGEASAVDSAITSGVVENCRASRSASGTRHAGRRNDSAGSVSWAATAPAQIACRVAAERRRQSATAIAATPKTTMPLMAASASSGRT